jgi:hypothetical protein
VNVSDRRPLVLGLIAAVLLHFNGVVVPVLSPLIDSVVPSIGVSAGPKEILIVYERESANATFQRMLVNLRNGEADKYILAKAHTLYALDHDAKDGDGNIAKPLAKWGKALQGVTLPAIVIGTPAGKVSHKQAISSDATAEAIMAIIKAKGG